MNKKYILFGPYPPPYGGVSIYVSVLYKYLKMAGINCELKMYKQNEFSNELVKQSFKSVIQHFYKVTSKTVFIDSCSFFLENPTIRSALAWLFIKIIKRPMWLKIIHDGSLPTRYKEFNFTRKLIFNLCIECIDEFIVVNDELYSWLTNEIRVSKPIHVIASLLPIQNEANITLHENYDKAFMFEKVICSIGVFIEKYGFEQIANAVEIVRSETGLDIGLLLIDGRFACDDTYKLSVINNRSWITVFANVEHPQTLEIFKKCDLFVRGFNQESYGLSRIEALWCDIPVIATRAGEQRGMILYDYGDIDELVKKIKESLCMPDKKSIQLWANYFQNEAENNIKQLMNVITKNRGPHA